VTRIIDAVALLVFVTIGLLSHHDGLSVGDYARVGLPFLGCWFIAAYVFGLYRRPTRGAFLRTWAVGIPAGVLVSRITTWSFHWDGFVFLLVALTFSLLFIVAARGLAVAMRLSPRASRASA
jgi:hypothetical protein